MSKQSYREFKQELKAAQKGLSREEILDRLTREKDEHHPEKSKFEDVFDPDTAQPIQHRWVDRGAVMTCEGAMHPSHRAFKR